VEFVRNEAVDVIRYPRTYQYLIAFNSQRQPFESPAVRRALNAAIDRQALVDRVLQGRGTPSSGAVWPRHWAYDTSHAGYSVDPNLATTLLDSAGLRLRNLDSRQPSRFQFTCLIPENFAVIERIALEVQKQLYAVGVDMQFEVVPAREFDARIRDRQFEAILIDMISGPTLERSYQFWRSRKRHEGLNVFGYENAEAERSFDVLRSSANEAAVRSATSRLQRAMLDDPPALFIAWNERARAVRRDFNVVLEEGRDPLHTLWRWTENRERRAHTTQ
jgi:peptide/nickel transport system substrate-binding protein